jgi:hypothetical protein
MSAAFVTRRDGYALAAHGELGATSVRGRLIVEAHELDDVPIRVDEVDLLNVVGSDASPPTGCRSRSAKDLR